MLDPAIRRDRRRVESLFAADFLEFGASGRVWNREAVVEHLAQESGTRVVLEDFHCVELSAQAALVTRSNRSARVSPVRRSLIWRMYWRNPVTSSE